MPKKTGREDILDCSATLFRRKGLRGTSMADIASATGLIKGSIYHYFPSKDALVLEVLDRAYKQFEDDVFAIAYDESQSPATRLAGMLDYILGYFRENKVCLMARLSLEDKGDLPAAQEKIRSFFCSWRDAFSEVLATAHETEAAQALADDIICRLEGATIWLHIFDDDAALVRACDAAAAMLPATQ